MDFQFANQITLRGYHVITYVGCLISEKIKKCFQISFKNIR